MGHERLPLLPKSKKWRDIVSAIALTATNERTTKEVVEKTAEAIDTRFRRLHLDPSVQDAFYFLLALSVAARSEAPQTALVDQGIDLHGKMATPIGLVQALSSFMRREGSSLENFELAKDAVAKALGEFFRHERSKPDLFEESDDPFTVWRKASDGGGFCVLARQFFSSLTTDYIQYFLDREASAILPSVEAREKFGSELESHIDQVTRYSFETSKITQSFAAGWYNKHATKNLPSPKETRRFLSIALNKIRDSLRREAAP